MKLKLLGTGGVSYPPRPTCFCKICEEARERGIPYARSGCSMFLEDKNILFDTPETIVAQLNRERINSVDHLILTHWHPDHTHGIRMLETINWNFAESKPFKDPILVYISEYQLEMFKKFSAGGFLEYYENKSIIKVVKIEDKKTIDFDGIIIKPYLIKQTKGFYFLISNGNKKIVYLPCEYHNVVIDETVRDVDTFITHNLFWENPKISPRISKPTDEDSFEKMLEDAKKMQAKQIILTHIEESFQLSHDELNNKLIEYYPDYNVTAGYDGQELNI